MVEAVYKAARDSIDAPVLFQGKEIGYITDLTFTMDNNPQDLATLDSRSVRKFAGGLTNEIKLSKTHSLIIEGNLFELAFGHKIIDVITENYKIDLDKELTFYWTISQPIHDSYFIWDDTLWKYAQPFVARGRKLSSAFKLYLKKISLNPEVRVSVSIWNESGGLPENRISGHIDIPHESIPTEFSWVALPDDIFKTIPGTDLNFYIGETYFLCLELQTFGTTGNEIHVGCSSYKTYLGTFYQWDEVNKVWLSTGEKDLSFEIYGINPLGIEIRLLLHEKEDGKKIEATFKNCKVYANDVTVEANSIIIDSGSIIAESLEIKEKI